MLVVTGFAPLYMAESGSDWDPEPVKPSYRQVCEKIGAAEPAIDSVV